MPPFLPALIGAMESLLSEGQKLELDSGTVQHVLLGGLEAQDEGWVSSM